MTTDQSTNLCRIWHGYTTPENANAYEKVFGNEVMGEIEGKEIQGLKQIKLLRRSLGDEVEFITLIEFESLEAVKAFAGVDYELAFVPDAARKVLKRFEERVQHYEVKISLKYD